MVTALVTPIVRNRFGRIVSLNNVLGEVSLADDPSAERGDVRIVHTHRTRGPALAGKVTGVLMEVARVKLLERPYSVLVISEEVGEPIELSTCILTVVSALTALAFPLVRQKVLGNCFDPYHATQLRCVHSVDCCSQTE